MMENYPDFAESTGYGTGGGLCGWNCRHNFIPFNPETMTNNLKQYGLEENKKMYENNQKQRLYERTIRKYKRLLKTEKTALENTKESEIVKKLKQNYLKYSNLIDKWTKKYKQFCKDNNLRTQMDRTQI